MRRRPAGAAIGLAVLAACGGSGSDDRPRAPSTPSPVGNRTCGVVCTLAVEGSGAGLRATVAIENPGDGKPVQVLAWDLPEDGALTRPVFAVERDDAEVPYRGPVVARDPPRADDYLSVPAGYRIWAAFRPGEAYDLGAPGTYALRYRTGVLIGGPGQVCELTSNRVEVRVGR